MPQPPRFLALHVGAARFDTGVRRWAIGAGSIAIMADPGGPRCRVGVYIGGEAYAAIDLRSCLARVGVQEELAHQQIFSTASFAASSLDGTFDEATNMSLTRRRGLFCQWCLLTMSWPTQTNTCGTPLNECGFLFC